MVATQDEGVKLPWGEMSLNKNKAIIVINTLMGLSDRLHLDQEFYFLTQIKQAS